MSRGRRTLADALAASRRMPAPAAPGVAEREDPASPFAAAVAAGMEMSLASLNSALVSGDEETARRMYMAHRGGQQEALEEAGSVDALRYARRIARAFAWLGEPMPQELLVRAPLLDRADVELLAARRTEGDEAVELLARQERRDGRSYTVTNTAEDFRLLARSVLATPSRFSFGFEEMTDGSPREVRLAVHPHALRELWEDPPGSARRRLELVRSRRRASGGEVLWVRVTSDGIINGVPTRVGAHTRLGETRADDAAGRMRSAVAHIRRKFPDMKPLIGEIADSESHLTKTAYGPLRERIDDAPNLRLSELVGDGACAHLNGRWVLNGAPVASRNCADAAIFNCPDCYREHVAVVPLHQIAPAHRLVAHLREPDRAEAYLARERFHRALAGDDRPVRSLVTLRSRQRPLACEDGSPFTVRDVGASRSGSLGAALGASGPSTGR